jgi:SAM-dependent methyltransferase
VDALVSELALGPASTVVDVAAGTGKLTRLLEPRIGRLIAVEPVDEMRAVLARRSPRVTALTGVAESLPIEDGSVDAVCVGDAFHWFDVERATKEIARVLRRSGGLGILKHAPAPPRELPAWRREYDALVAAEQTFDPGESIDAPLDDPRSWRQTLRGNAWLDEVCERLFEQVQVQDPAGLLAYTASRAFVWELPQEQREALFARLDGVLDRHGVTRVETRHSVSFHVLKKRDGERR